MRHASSLYSTFRQVGAAVGVATLATGLVSRGNTHVAAALRTGAPPARLAARQHGLLLVFHDAFAAALTALIGVAGALLIHDADAAATLRRAPVAAELQVQVLPEQVAETAS